MRKKNVIYFLCPKLSAVIKYWNLKERFCFMKTDPLKNIDELVQTLQSLKKLSAQICGAAQLCAKRISEGSSIFSCGNGGSAADAMHFAEELSGRYKHDRRALPGICLNSDSCALTCIANDFGYERVFARQLEAFAKAGDVLVLFSSSGTSPNLVAALETAKRLGVYTVMLCGKDGGKCAGLADAEIIVPSQNGARVQEAHSVLLHTIIEEIEANIQK